MKTITVLLFQLLFVFSGLSQDIVKYTTANLRMRLDTTTNSEIISVNPEGSLFASRRGGKMAVRENSILIIFSKKSY
jgi:hypothetical protein